VNPAAGSGPAAVPSTRPRAIVNLKSWAALRGGGNLMDYGILKAVAIAAQYCLLRAGDWKVGEGGRGRG
jgi:hypothetical protein